MSNAERQRDSGRTLNGRSVNWAIKSPCFWFTLLVVATLCERVALRPGEWATELDQRHSDSLLACQKLKSKHNMASVWKFNGPLEVREWSNGYFFLSTWMILFSLDQDNYCQTNTRIHSSQHTGDLLRMSGDVVKLGSPQQHWSNQSFSNLYQELGAWINMDFLQIVSVFWGPIQTKRHSDLIAADGFTDISDICITCSMAHSDRCHKDTGRRWRRRLREYRVSWGRASFSHCYCTAW